MATLSKDLYNEEMKKRASDETGLKTKLQSAMILVAESWRDSIAQGSKKLWGGSSASIEKITDLMATGLMFNDASALPGADELQYQFKRVISAIMIPQAWALSPAQVYPVIIHEDIACDQSPSIDWLSVFIHYITREAYDKRYCGANTDNKSYWLLGPNKPSSSCNSGSSGGMTNCAAWGLPIGHDKIESYNLTRDDIIVG
ncbi:hypothetical protein VE02_05584 [Pseudogymnoascus sp. 03VT05]|nr:hypothetical protein VE02_05584 [Pseudogymnoascus sp. 03VT05]